MALPPDRPPGLDGHHHQRQRDPCRAGGRPPTGGTGVADLRYKAWGETRYTHGTTPTQVQPNFDKSAGLRIY